MRKKRSIENIQANERTSDTSEKNKQILCKNKAFVDYDFGFLQKKQNLFFFKERKYVVKIKAKHCKKTLIDQWCLLPIIYHFKFCTEKFKATKNKIELFEMMLLRAP